MNDVESWFNEPSQKEGFHVFSLRIMIMVFTTKTKHFQTHERWYRRELFRIKVKTAISDNLVDYAVWSLRRKARTCLFRRNMEKFIKFVFSNRLPSLWKFLRVWMSARVSFSGDASTVRFSRLAPSLPFIVWTSLARNLVLVCLAASVKRSWPCFFLVAQNVHPSVLALVQITVWFTASLAGVIISEVF